MAGSDPFEDRLRESLRFGDPADPPTDVQSFLDDVHRGARSRRRRHTVGIAAAAALVVIGGGAAAGSLGLFEGDETPVADRSTRTTPGSTSDSTPGPSSQTSEASPHVATATPTRIANNGQYTTANTSIVSLTSTGSDHQWALGMSPGKECGQASPCATVLERPADGGPVWKPLGQLPLPAASDDHYDDATVNQLRYVGDPFRGYAGYAFGGGLLTTHDDPATGTEAGLTWGAPDLPVEGEVTYLEAHGTTVYAIVTDASGSSALVTSSTSIDAFETVDTGVDLGTASSLVSTAGVVAFLDQTASGTEVVSSPADAVTGEATGVWTTAQPCDAASEPIQLSSSSDALWALCAGDKADSIRLLASSSDGWRRVYVSPAGHGPVLAARSPDSALVSLLDGTVIVTLNADKSTVQRQRLSAPPFSAPAMLGFTNPDLGFAIAQGVVYRTTDGGHSWTVDPILPAG